MMARWSGLLAAFALAIASTTAMAYLGCAVGDTACGNTLQLMPESRTGSHAVNRVGGRDAGHRRSATAIDQICRGGGINTKHAVTSVRNGFRTRFH
jgi:hypothetical protein